MNTIDLFRKIMQKELQECRRVCPEREGESPGLNGITKGTCWKTLTKYRTRLPSGGIITGMGV